MSLTDGLLNEDRMIQAINDKTYNELNSNLQHLVNFIYPSLDKKAVIKCYHAEEFTKPDIVIDQNGKRVFVSLKHGTADGVHEERLNSFIAFLKENGVDDYSIESYLLYHFGDGTTDGSGKTRLDSYDVRIKYDERIRKLNEDLNKNKTLLMNFAERVMFQGVRDDAYPAEVIYHGDEDYGTFMSKRQFDRYLELRKWDYMKFVVHIGPFVLRPKARYPRGEVKNNDNRLRVVVSFPKLSDYIRYIAGRFVF